MNFLSTIKNTCLRHHFFKRGNRILIAVSGGPDSVALLYALNALRHTFGLQLYMAHLNHGLRPEAVKEQAYVKELAKKLGLPLFTKTIKLRHTKGSLEEIARKARLVFLTDTAKKIKAQGIALGHHQDDLAETILMRILRGAGPLGIKGILPKREINGIVFLRPLLETNRCEINKFLQNKKIKFYTDASNRNTDFFRNKVRLRLLPLLEKIYNPNIKKILIHFSQSISLAYDYLKIESEDVLRRCLIRNKLRDGITIDVKKILRCHPAVLRETMRLAIEKVLGHTRSLTFAHIEAIEHLVKDQPGDATVHLPYNLSAIKKRNFLYLKRSQRRLLIKQKNTL